MSAASAVAAHCSGVYQGYTHALYIGRRSPNRVRGMDMSGTWQSLTNQPTFSAGTMLLLTDGSVLCHDEPNSGSTTGTTHWWRLVPDITGSYVNGTWQQVADSRWAPLYFACSLLRD